MGLLKLNQNRNNSDARGGPEPTCTAGCIRSHPHRLLLSAVSQNVFQSECWARQASSPACPNTQAPCEPGLKAHSKRALDNAA